ncbi:MAG: hypothetical protein GWP59_00385 [Chlamydiales bacterium]|nr:hypothetical protein [Chlamydiales bacterium]
MSLYNSEINEAKLVNMDKGSTVKVCWSCDGKVSNQSVQCPYCGAHLGTQQESSLGVNSQAQSSYTSEDASQKPRYQQVKTVSSEDNFTPLYSQSTGESSSEDSFERQSFQQASPEASASKHYEEAQASGSVKEMLAFSLLLVAMGLFLFSIILFLFSKDGYLVLKWKSSYWLFCLLLSIPVFFFGWRALGQVEECEA